MTPPVTILLLDDEPLLRRATALLLSNRGGDVTTVATTEEAVALAASGRFDVAVIDLADSAVRVLEAAARVRGAGASPTRVIAAFEGPVEARDAAQVDTILSRPYPFDDLESAVFGAQARPPIEQRVRAPRRRASVPARPALSRVSPRALRRAPRAASDPG